MSGSPPGASNRPRALLIVSLSLCLFGDSPAGGQYGNFSPEPPLAGGGAAAPLNPPPAADPADPPVPAVAVRIRVPASAAAGKDLEYRLTVDNVSRAAAHHVLLRVPLPAGTRFGRADPQPTAREPELQWSLGTLQPGARRETTLVLVPTGEGDVRCCARIQFEHGQCVRTRLAKSDLRLRLDGPAQALRYDAVIYRAEIVNAGPAPATDVVLADTLPEGLEYSTSNPSTAGENPLTWKLGTIGPGQTRRIEYTVFAKGSGALTTKAVLTAAGGLRQEASSTVTVGEAKLSATKTGPRRRMVNRPAAYQITVQNPGTMPVTGLRVEDEIPRGLVFVSASDGGRLEGSFVRWALGTLAPGVRRTVQLVVQAPKAGEFTNVATITAERGLRATASAVTIFEAVTGLNLEIDKGEDPVEVGKPVTYSIRVLNQGSAAAGGIGLTVLLPEQLKFVDARGPTAHQQDRDRITFAPLASLAAGRFEIYRVTVQAQRAGEARFRVELTANQLAPGNPLKQEESTSVIEAGSPPPMPAAAP